MQTLLHLVRWKIVLSRTCYSQKNSQEYLPTGRGTPRRITKEPSHPSPSRVLFGSRDIFPTTLALHTFSCVAKGDGQNFPTVSARALEAPSQGSLYSRKEKPHNSPSFNEFYRMNLLSFSWGPDFRT